MDRPKSDFPEPPALPSFRIDDAESGEDVSEEGVVLTRHAGTDLVRHNVDLPKDKIDADAALVVRKLERAGFEAYLVGGCVRDLLLGGKPKDYDVATSARPEDVRRLFRNCRIIGRRFRLAHILFARNKVIEVATFRRNPGAEGEDDATSDLLIRNDNSFGDAHEDALRRDFTINGLFYDLDRRQVLDWVDGMRDIERRTIDTIGVPSVRFREDPIRMLRAVKFAARRDLGIDPVVYDAMVTHVDELRRASKPRVFEELLRLLRGGAAHRSMWLLWEIGAMGVLLPELSAFLDDSEATGGAGDRFWRSMSAIDQLTKEREAPPDDAALVSALLREPIAEACFSEANPGEAMLEFLESMVTRLGLTRRIADLVRRILIVQSRLAKRQVAKFTRHDWLPAAIDAFEIHAMAKGGDRAFAAELRREIPAPLGRNRTRTRDA